MSETAVLAAVQAVVTALAVAAEVFGEDPEGPLPRVHDRPIVIVERDDTGLLVTPLTLGVDQWRYTVRIRALLGGPSVSGQRAGAAAAGLATTLAGAWTADPRLGGLVAEARWAGDSTNLATYRAAKEAPTWIGRLLITEWVPR